jgi:hypothetical protein
MARGMRFERRVLHSEDKGESMKLVRHSLLFLLIAAMVIPLQAAAEDENSREVQQ